MTLPVEISKAHGVPVAVLMASPCNGKGLDAQCEYIQTLIERGMCETDIALIFGKSLNWVTRRIDRPVKRLVA
jgi:hypothetical protein